MARRRGAKRRTFIVLGAGATLGAGFKVGRSRPPLDMRFFRHPVVKRLLAGGRMPATSWYLGATSSSRSLEQVWSEVDLRQKLALGGILSEETALAYVRPGDEVGVDYLRKFEREEASWRVPAIAQWELRGAIVEALGAIQPPAGESPLVAVVDAVAQETELVGVAIFNDDATFEMLFHAGRFAQAGASTGTAGDEALPCLMLHGSLN